MKILNNKIIRTLVISLTAPLILSVTSQVNAATELYFIHNDHLGTPQVVTDKDQVVVWEGKQKPFGEVEVTTSTTENDTRFPGQYFDVESKLHYNYFRDYDPTIGRYIQSDPIGLGGGINTYGYVYQNPIMNADPTGLLCGTGLCVAGGIAVADLIWAGAGTAAVIQIANVISSMWSEGVDHPEEEEALNATCDDASWAIPELKRLIESRKRQYKASGGGNIAINPSGPGHKTRIKILEDKLKWLEECPKICP